MAGKTPRKPAKAVKKAAAKRRKTESKTRKDAAPKLLSGGNPQIAKAFLSFHCFTNYVKVTFFRGASLRPVPPGESKYKDVRYLDIYEGELDSQFADWVKQAAALPGEKM